MLNVGRLSTELPEFSKTAHSSLRRETDNRHGRAPAFDALLSCSPQRRNHKLDHIFSLQSPSSLTSKPNRYRFDGSCNPASLMRLRTIALGAAPPIQTASCRFQTAQTGPKTIRCLYKAVN